MDGQLLVNTCPTEEARVTVCRLLLLGGSDKGTALLGPKAGQQRGVPTRALRVAASSPGEEEKSG